ncbi:MAG: methionine ABC transporter ATP-binding protein [Aedoeadaptatus pacaensis]
MIDISNVHKNFGEFEALKGLDLQIEEGEIFGIIGKSGSGKSTLLRCINGLISVDTGKIIVDGTEVQNLENQDLLDFRKNIGMIFQHFSLVSRLNVFENIGLPLKIKGYKQNEVKEKIENIAKLVGLEDKLESRPSELSGGQKQRVAIARALVTNPKIILSDESTSALDPENTESILNLFLELNRKLKVTIVIVSHEMDVIRSICDRIMILERGQIKEICTPLEHICEEFHLKRFDSNDSNLEAFDIQVENREDSQIVSQLSRKLSTDVIIHDTKGYTLKGKKIMFFRLLVPKEHGSKVPMYLDELNAWWGKVE